MFYFLESIPAEFFEYCGHFGVACYLISYAALQFGLIKGRGYLYTALNLAGATCVLITTYVAFNLSLLLTSLFWIVASLYGLGRIYFLHRSSSLSSREQSLVDYAFLGISRTAARQFMDSGDWGLVEKGKILTLENQPVETVYFLYKGQVSISKNENKINSISKGFIGEINILSAGAASATVQCTVSCEVFQIKRKHLLKLIKSDEEMSLIINNAFGRSIARKLLDTNAQMEKIAKTIKEPIER